MPRAIWVIAILFVVVTALANAQPSSKTPSPVSSAAVSAPAFDVNAAVETYLAKMSPAQRARSTAYFEGGYWLSLWDFLAGCVVMWLLLQFGWSARMRNFSERITRFRPFQTALYWVQFILVTSILTFPLTIYEGYFREHSYGLLNQTFGPWMKDQLVGLAVSLVLGAILVV